MSKFISRDFLAAEVDILLYHKFARLGQERAAGRTLFHLLLRAEYYRRKAKSYSRCDDARKPMRVILISLPLAGFGFNALAADLPVRPYALPVPFFTWTGFYEGVFAGYGTIDNTTRPVCFTSAGVPEGLGCAARAPLHPQTDDLVAGTELGYYHQPTPGSGLVIGAAGDYAFTRIRGYESQTGTFPVVGGRAFPAGIYHVGQRLDGLGTVRGKLGYAFDRLLVYGTAGLAAGNVRIDSNTGQMGHPLFDAGHGEVRIGYVAGGGIEYAFSQRLSTRTEALYYDLGARTVVGGEVSRLTGPRFGSRVETSGYQVRVGINDWFGNGLPLIGLFEEFRSPSLEPVLPDSIWAFETGARYFYSSGSHRYTLGDPLTPGQTDSRLTYRGFDAHAGESFGRLDHNPTGLFLKGFLGSGYVHSGRLNDEDFPPRLKRYSNTQSRIKDGDIAYTVIDVGYDVLRGENYKLGAFVGFQYFAELPNGFGCRQIADGKVCARSGSALTSVKTLSEDAHWYALRVGLAGSVQFDRFKVSLEGAYLPIVELSGNDRHWQRPDINPLPQRANGDGYFVEGVVSHDLTPRISVGVGVRYWRMSAPSGRTQFPFNPPSSTKFETDRYGGFAQLSYRISDLGLAPLISRSGKAK